MTTVCMQGWTHPLKQSCGMDKCRKVRIPNESTCCPELERKEGNLVCPKQGPQANKYCLSPVEQCHPCYMRAENGEWHATHHRQ
jgi:hypothetical protein